MTKLAKKENYSAANEPLVQRRSLQFRAAMFWSMKWWIGLYLVAMAFAMIDVRLTPVAYVLNVLSIVFLFAALGRMTCIGTYLLTGVEARAKDEISYTPAKLCAGFCQRLYIATGVIIRELGMSIIASGSLLLVDSGWAPMVNAGATPILMALSVTGMLCLLIRLVLIHCHTMGWLSIYEPGERLHLDRAVSETDAVLPPAPIVMRILALCRRAAAAWLIFLAFTTTLILAGQTDFRFWIPEFEKWSLYTCAAIGGLVCLYTLVRFIIIALAFARYSMVQVIGMQLLLGTLITLTIHLPKGWNVLALLSALVAGFMCFYYIALQDPDGDRYIPEFVRKQVRARRRERWQKEKEQKDREKLAELACETAASRRVLEG
ncbi:MAG TPA: hypothetical protein VEJ63_13750 [Planctomycetota bacterium]|nr:hypothetical protein [Planctomycetota bacterium]